MLCNSLNNSAGGQLVKAELPINTVHYRGKKGIKVKCKNKRNQVEEYTDVQDPYWKTMRQGGKEAEDKHVKYMIYLYHVLGFNIVQMTML